MSIEKNDKLIFPEERRKKKDIDNSASPKVRTNEKLKKKTDTKGKGIEGDVLKIWEN